MRDGQNIFGKNGCGEELMLYLHIPFCVKKCNYCDFLSGPCSGEVQRKYLDALQKEIRSRCRDLAGREISSVFIGGGTPSLLEPGQIGELLAECRKSLVFQNGAEMTVECNPGTVDFARLRGFLEAGINRLSIGLQSARNEELSLLGRIHTWEEFQDTYIQAGKAGFRNINVDLISALPGQTPETWEETLQKVLALEPAPQHLSVYSLILEEGTAFYEMDREGKFCGSLSLPSEETDRLIYEETSKILTRAGYRQYEISNYAKPGFACRHNCGYWKRRDYLGLGVGAASLLGDTRYANTRDIQAYIRDPLAGRKEQRLTKKEAMEEFLFLGLRMLEGIGRAEFYSSFGVKLDEIYRGVIRKNCGDGLLTDDGERIRLTKRGLDLSNYVFRQFLL